MDQKIISDQAADKWQLSSKSSLKWNDFLFTPTQQMHFIWANISVNIIYPELWYDCWHFIWQFLPLCRLTHLQAVGGFSQSFCRDATLPSPLLSSFLPSSPFPSLHAPPPTAVRGIPLSFLPIGGLFTAKSNSHRRAGHDKTVLSVSLPLRWCELDSRQLRTIAGRKCEVWTRSEQSSIHAGTPDIRLSHLPACWPPPPRRGPGRQLRLAARPPQTQRSCRPTPRKM